METSDFIINQLILPVKAGSMVLEPSAGKGKLALALRRKKCDVTCVELNDANADYLFNEHHFTTHKIDFMMFGTVEGIKQEFDYVVAVPPYNENIDCRHIMKMYEHLKTGGKVISLTLPLWTTGIFQVQKDFRKWLRNKKYTIEFIEDESYVNCPKAIITITKE